MNKSIIRIFLAILILFFGLNELFEFVHIKGNSLILSILSLFTIFFTIDKTEKSKK